MVDSSTISAKSHLRKTQRPHKGPGQRLRGKGATGKNFRRNAMYSFRDGEEKLPRIVRELCGLAHGGFDIIRTAFQPANHVQAFVLSIIDGADEGNKRGFDLIIEINMIANSLLLTRQEQGRK